MIRGILCLFISLIYVTESVQAQDWELSRRGLTESISKKNADSALYWYRNYQNALPADSIKTAANINLITGLARFFYEVKSSYSQAAVLYQEASAIISKHYGPESDEFAMNENFLGQVWYFQRDYSKAESYYLNSKRILEKVWGKKSAKYAVSCNALGVLYNDKGDYQNAELQHAEARTIREQLFTKENGAYAQSCNNLAVTYWNLGQNDKAEPLAIEAKEIRGRVAGIPKSAYAISCVNLANIYRDMGKFLQAEPLYIEARKVREEFFTKEHDLYALSCTILADLYYFMKQFDKAEPLYLEAKDIRLRLDPSKSYYYAQSCSDLAQLYREMSKYSQAESLALEADSIFKGMGDAVASERALNNNSLGALYFFMKEYEKAENLLLEARKTWEKSLGEYHPYYSSNSMSLARLSWAKKNFSAANNYYLKAIEAQQHQANRMFSFTSENEKQLYLDNIAANDDEYHSFYYAAMTNSNNGQPYAISLAHRNQVLSSSLQLRQRIFASGDTSLSQIYTRWTDTKKRLAFLYSRTGTNTADDAKAKETIAQLETIAGVMEKELVRKMAAHSTAISESANWRTIQSTLTENEAAIEFIEFKFFNGERSTDSVFYAALILKKNATEPEMVRLFEKRELDSLLISSADGIATINKIYTRGLGLKKNNTVSQRSYEKIWLPLESKLAGITRIYFAPAGLLHRIAFSALPINTTTVLSDKYELVQVSSTATLLNRTSDIIGEKDSIVLFGGIRYTADPKAVKPAVTTGKVAKRSGFGYLPGTESEVSGIAMNGRVKKYKPRVFTGQAAKENIIKDMNGTRSPRVLHIATHGFFFDDPQQDIEPVKKASSGGQAFKQSGNPLFRAGLLFAGANDSWNGKYIEGQNEDGILTAYEVSNMYLPNTSLVVLSACETALGDIKGSEGVYGLQRSFKMAGVNYLLMSLWKVPDVETSEFMQLFYKNIFDGKPIDHSFTIAQSAMKTKYRREPFKWAAWILVK